MSGWSRRSVLAALGLSPLAAACGGAGAGKRGDTTAAPSVASTRAVLRELVGSMSTRFPYAAALAVVSRRDRATADAAERRHESIARAEVVFTAIDGDGARHERRTADLSTDGLARAADDLLGSGSGGAFGDPRKIAAKLDGDPRRTDRWTDRAADLFERSRRHGGSRIVYRSAVVDVDDSEIAFVGDGRDWLQRIVRARNGAVFVGAAGTTSHTSVAQRGGTGGLDTIALDDDALEAAADAALVLLTARRPPSGEFDLVLDPAATAHLIGSCVAPALDRELWESGASRAAALRDQPIGTEAVTLIDDPTLPGGYGTHYFDSEGREAAPVTLVDRGVLAGSFAGGRGPTNLLLARGEIGDRDAMLAEADNGLLLEGALAAFTDPARWSVGLRAARAREIAGGKLTGRLYGPLMVRGDVPGLLGAVRAVGAEQTLAVGDGCSIGAPYLLTRGAVAG